MKLPNPVVHQSAPVANLYYNILPFSIPF